MYKLLNMCDFGSISEIEKSMSYYMDKFHFDGFEMIKFTDRNIMSLKKNTKGYHLRFFPCWLDLYRENYDILYRELVNKKNIKDLCGGTTKEELISFYKDELERAKELEVEYIVFHPCNIYIIESLHYKFYYSNREVLEGVVSFLNEIFKDGEYNFKLLLENLWWSGLRLDNYEDAHYLMENIKYHSKGFLLDTGHMFNNNLELKNSDEGIEYIKRNLDKLKEYKNYIYAVHLNYSLSGEYTKKAIELYKDVDNYNVAIEKVYPHIAKIDSHQPFENKKIVDILRSVPALEYLIYELICNSEEELDLKIEKQDICIKGFIK